MPFPPPSILLAQLAQSTFRARFTLNSKEQVYLRQKGLETIMQHGSDFISQRLAPTFPKNDGKQTPWKGHPIFVAQHATATCCRGCLEKWYKITKKRPLTVPEQDYILQVIRQWLKNDIRKHPPYSL